MSRPPLTTRLSHALREGYLVRDVVGEGGMATVHRAFELKHHRDVALNVLRPELSLAGNRFLQEIRVTAGLLALVEGGERGPALEVLEASWAREGSGDMWERMESALRCALRGDVRTATALLDDEDLHAWAHPDLQYSWHLAQLHRSGPDRIGARKPLADLLRAPDTGGSR